MNTPTSNRPATRQIPDYSDPGYWHGTIKMSLSKFFVLSVLHRKPMHGYEVVQAVEKTTNGCCSPSQGTVYPVLNEFEAGGYLTHETDIVQGRERKIYSLTDKGRLAFQVATTAWMEATACIAEGKALSDCCDDKSVARSCCPTE